MKVLAIFFKILFNIPFFGNRYYGFYSRIFKPRGLFKGMTANCRFDSDFVIQADLDEWIQQHVYFLGTWDERGLNFLKNNLKEGDVFVDVGANIGCYSMVAAKLVGKTGSVHSFEPVTKVFGKLQQNILLNKLDNITANKKAVFESSGNIELYVSSNENAGMSSIFHHDTESGEIEKTEAVSLDDYFADPDIQKISMIKIDIEGAELFALKGMKTILDKFRPVIIMEVSEAVIKNSGIEGKESLEFLKSHNYEIRRIFQCGNTGDIADSKSSYTNFAFFPL